MKKEDIKDGCLVTDRWYPEKGIGKITNKKKTVFTVSFPRESIQYDFAHAQFLDMQEDNNGIQN